MYWPKFNQKKLMRKLRERGSTASGIACFYIRWTKNAGLKVYKTKRERNGAMRRQRRAAEHGLGPRVGVPVDIEVASVLTVPDVGPIIKPVTLYCFFTEHLQKIRYPSEKQFIELDCALQRIGIFHEDLHFNNVAKKGDRLLCIDFGTEGCSLGRPIKNPEPHEYDDCSEWCFCSKCA